MIARDCIRFQWFRPSILAYFSLRIPHPAAQSGILLLVRRIFGRLDSSEEDREVRGNAPRRVETQVIVRRVNGRYDLGRVRSVPSSFSRKRKDNVDRSPNVQ